MLKVAAYCRVSTDKDDQVNSLENQKEYFTKYIHGNALWELTKIYVDEGISGTSTKKRQAFHQMISDAKTHQMDLILTKEISRFARNTLDSIYYTRFLKELGIGVVFLSDNINTLDADAELRLTIMSSIAQEESRKTSERVKWGQKRSMEQGIVFGRNMLGFDVVNGKLKINEQGANIVRLIFHKFVYEGKGTHVIAKELTEDGIPTINNGCIWHNNVILRILKNEKYCGDLIQKKTYTPNYLNHEKKVNRGQEEYIILENHHEAIISKELFLLAKKELNLRSPKDENKQKYSNRHLFSGKVKCGLCGSSFVCRTKKDQKGNAKRSWRCYKSLQRGKSNVDLEGYKVGCDCPQVNEENLKQMLMFITKNINIDNKFILNNLIININTVINESDSSATNEKAIEKLTTKINKINIKKEKLIELYIENSITKDEFLKQRDKLDIEIDIHNQELTKKSTRRNIDKQISKEDTKVVNKVGDKVTSVEYNFNKDKDKNLNESNILVSINTITGIVNGDEWSDAFYQAILERVVVFGQDRIEVYLKHSPEKWCFRIV
ncbi:MAG: site-specific recombinase, invertase Pin [Anaerocolumna sp.]|jgi:DNA invertase Pin-like site-specific DNA recombinase|nr:site-specific recombinase, invertase Pin [Anaerocolumna sp.]